MTMDQTLSRLINAKYFHLSYRVLAVVLLGYALSYGLIMDVPAKMKLQETIRNLYYHVPMWFVLVLLGFASAFFSGWHLRTGSIVADQLAESMAIVATVFGTLGFLTGMLWAEYTWGNWWAGDVKQICALSGLLMYFAYFILRKSFNENQTSARVSAVYNILAFCALIPLLFIIPRNAEFSLHPGGKGGDGGVGNPAFSKYDLDNHMRLVFYPAILGWLCLSIWITDVIFRFKNIYFRRLLKENS